MKKKHLKITNYLKSIIWQKGESVAKFIPFKLNQTRSHFQLGQILLYDNNYK